MTPTAARLQGQQRDKKSQDNGWGESFHTGNRRDDSHAHNPNGIPHLRLMGAWNNGRMADTLARRYRLDERIGVGGVGTVWRAFDLNLHRDVAAKTLDVTATHDDPEAVPRFRREAIAAAGLSHPNIVGVYDTGTDGDLAYLVMELLTGPSLRDLIRDEGFLHFDEGLRIAKSVGEGLAAAHAIGLIHRDIKPGNVMLHHDVPKIVDFGIARLEQEAGEALTRPATAIGTPAYIAPEQALGEPATPASDIYSFGCLLMALFTGRPPFRAEQPLALTHAHVSEAPPHLADLRPDTPPALDELVSRMLEKDPRVRPTAKDVVTELTRIAANHDVASGLPARVRPAVVADVTTMMPISDAPLPTQVIEERRVAPVAPARGNSLSTVVLAVLAVALLAALAYGAWVFFGNNEPEPPPAPAPTTQTQQPAPPPPTQRPTQSQTTAAPTTSAPTTSAPVPTQTVTVTATPIPTQAPPTTQAPTTAPPPAPTTEAPAPTTQAPRTAPPPEPAPTATPVG